MVVDQINSELAQLDKDVGTINSRVNHHRAEIDESRSQSKVTEKLVSDLVRCLEVLEERDVLTLEARGHLPSGYIVSSL